MLLNLPIDILIVLVPILIFSLCFHEFSHGYIAYKLGDNTANDKGRLTLNPLSHLDPIGSIMILIIGFGCAKHVPVNSRNLKNPRSDLINYLCLLLEPTLWRAGCLSRNYCLPNLSAVPAVVQIQLSHAALQHQSELLHHIGVVYRPLA